MKRLSSILCAFLILACIFLSGCVNQPKNVGNPEVIPNFTQIPIVIENGSQLEDTQEIDPANRSKIEVNSSREDMNDAIPWASRFL